MLTQCYTNQGNVEAFGSNFNMLSLPWIPPYLSVPPANISISKWTQHVNFLDNHLHLKLQMSKSSPASTLKCFGNWSSVGVSHPQERLTHSKAAQGTYQQEHVWRKSWRQCLARKKAEAELGMLRRCESNSIQSHRLTNSNSIRLERNFCFSILF